MVKIKNCCTYLTTTTCVFDMSLESEMLIRLMSVAEIREQITIAAVIFALIDFMKR